MIDNGIKLTLRPEIARTLNKEQYKDAMSYIRYANGKLNKSEELKQSMDKMGKAMILGTIR